MKKINIKKVEYIAYELAKEEIMGGEPIPPFDSRYPNILESCLAVPFQKFNNKFLYKGLIKKAAVLFYYLIKNHPFQNGNKRIAVTSLLSFLYLNNNWIKVSNQELYNFAIWIAESPAPLKNSVVLAIEDFIRKNRIQINKGITDSYN